MRITMIGGGYVGLVSGACFAEFGTEVTVVETDAAKARRAARRPDADLRTGPRQAGGGKRQGRPAGLHRRSGRGGGRDRGRLHRGRHTHAARRRPCRPDLCLRGGGAGRPSADRLCGDRHQIDGPGRHRPPHRRNRPRRRARTWSSTSPPTPNSCARATPSATSCGRTAWSSAPNPTARGRCCAVSTGRCT